MRRWRERYGQLCLCGARGRGALGYPRSRPASQVTDAFPLIPWADAGEDGLQGHLIDFTAFQDGVEVSATVSHAFDALIQRRLAEVGREANVGRAHE